MEKMIDSLNIKMPPELLALLTSAAEMHGMGRCEYARHVIEAEMERLDEQRRSLNAMFEQRDRLSK